MVEGLSSEMNTLTADGAFSYPCEKTPRCAEYNDDVGA